jgi:uncharacterized protein (TIGR02391 family)
MKSTNFEFLQPKWEELADLGAIAEQYTHPDPQSASAKLRTFAEQIVLFIYHKHGLPKPYQCNLNDLLTNANFLLGDNGKLRRIDAASTIDQALERTNRLHAALTQRSVHTDVLKFCKAELLEENYFHAVFEAMKSITAKIKSLSGSTGDGCDLVHDAFGQKLADPLLVINPFKTETQRGEQNGFMNLLKGLYSTIRYPLAHDPQVGWDMSEQDALNILAMISLVHRKLDQARRLVR